MAFYNDSIDLHPEFKAMVDARAMARGYGDDRALKAAVDAEDRARVANNARHGAKINHQLFEKHLDPGWCHEYLGSWPTRVTAVYDCMKTTMTADEARAASGVAKLKPYSPPRFIPSYSEEGGY